MITVKLITIRIENTNLNNASKYLIFLLRLSLEQRNLELILSSTNIRTNVVRTNVVRTNVVRTNVVRTNVVRTNVVRTNVVEQSF